MNSQHNNKSINKLLIICKKLYDKAPAHLRWILSPAKSIYTLFNVFRPGIWIITGNEISSEKKLIIAFAGHEENKNLLTMLAFADSYEETCIGKKWLWKISGVVKKSNRDCSLMVAEVPNFLRSLSEKMKCFYLPSWLSGEIVFSVDKSALFKNRNSSLKSDISKIKKNKLQFEVTNEPTQLKNFYYDMYLPFMTKVHGERSVIPSYDYVKSEFANRDSNMLLLIKKEDEYIAGIILLCKKNNTKLWSLGVKGGNIDHVRDGAIGALFYFSILHAEEQGFTKIQFGGSRPFLKDGVLQYKKKWNQKIYNRKDVGFLIKPISETDGVKGFFVNNPFIYQDKTGLSGAIFVANDQSLSEKDFAKIYKEYYVRGLSKLVIFRLGETDSRALSIVPPEFSDRITMCSAESIF